MTSQTLEQKTEKINLKQWIPVYGLYQLIKDRNKDKQTILNEDNLTLEAHATYQAFSVFAAGAGLYALAERIF